MRQSGKASIAFQIVLVGVLCVRVVAACSCAPPVPAPSGTPPVLRMPSMQEEHSAVFVGIVEDVYPRTLSVYKARWRQIFHEELSEDRPPTLERLRRFVLQFWPNLFSPSEQERIKAAKSLDDIESAVGNFWLTPRRIRLRIIEPFAGPKTGVFTLYTGLGDGDCGVDFKIGERWLIDAYIDDAGRWIAHLCSVTIPVKNAAAVLSKLRSERR